MELNTKSQFLWDWENLFMFSSKPFDTPKKTQLLDSKLDVMEGFEATSFYSCGGGGGQSEVGSDGSASNFRYGSSSKSASVDSSTNKESLLRFDAAKDSSLKDPNRKRELPNIWQQSKTNESPVCSSESSLIGLMLGRRTYFEDVSAGNNGKNAAPIPTPLENANTGKRSKVSFSLKTENHHCQVEGCGLDLSSAKDYHRKHRVCETHAKSPRVIVAGLERRFCQQCSRFHSLSEFDQKKRSCRRRLSDHNTRRRKPRPEIIQFNSLRLPASLYDGRQQIAFDQVPIVADATSTWDFAAASKVPRARLGLLSTTKAGGINELHLTSSNEPQQHGGAKHFHHSTQLSPSNRVTSKVFPEGLQVSTTPTNLDATQNLRALSLLSNSWGSSKPTAPLNQPMLNNHSTRASQPSPSLSSIHHPASSEVPPTSSRYWKCDQQSATPAPSKLNGSKTNVDNSNRFQQFQLFKAPSEPSFYMY